jgi:hypothetical protein
MEGQIINEIVSKNRAYFHPHLGYGDIINMIGAIRYYAKIYDEVIVACRQEKLVNCRLFFRDDPKIILEVPFSENIEQIKKVKGVNQVFLCGFHNPNKTPITNNNVPDCFYKDVKLDPKIRITHFHFEVTDNAKILYQNLVNIGKKYIFVHDKSSNLKIDLMELKTSHPNHLVINCDYNMYLKNNPYNMNHKGMSYHNIVQAFVGHPIIDYSEIIKNADGVYVIDSCMFCLANSLDLSKVKKKVVYVRHGRSYPTYLQKGFILRSDSKYNKKDKI